MPIYDPKGTHWARYTTTQHGPMPVKAAAGVKGANARAASSGASNYQFHQAVANPVAKSPRAGPPPLVAAALRAVADGQYLAASSALKMAARESVQKSYGAHLMASSVSSPAFAEAGWVGATSAPTTCRVGTSVP